MRRSMTPPSGDWGMPWGIPYADTLVLCLSELDSFLIFVCDRGVDSSLGHRAREMISPRYWLCILEHSISD